MKRSRLERIFFLLKRRALVKSVFRHLKHKLEKRQPKIIPEIELSEFMPNGVEETILDSPNADHDGNVSQQELRAICKVIKHFKPANLFEIGTFEGHTTAHMAANAPKTSRVFTLDLPAQEINHTALRIKTSDSTFIQRSGRDRSFFPTKDWRTKSLNCTEIRPALTSRPTTIKWILCLWTAPILTSMPKTIPESL